MRRGLISLIIWEMQIKTTYLTVVRMSIIKSPQTLNAWENVKKRETSYTVGGKVNWYSRHGK